MLPEVSLGLWQNFGDTKPLEDQRAILRRAFDLGVTHFDLVPCQASFASARMAQTRRSGAVQLGAIPCGSVASELQSP
jgi:hypothetical protein